MRHAVIIIGVLLLVIGFPACLLLAGGCVSEGGVQVEPPSVTTTLSAPAPQTAHAPTTQAATVEQRAKVAMSRVDQSTHIEQTGSDVFTLRVLSICALVGLLLPSPIGKWWGKLSEWIARARAK